HHVGLARRRAEHHAEAVHVHARGAGVHHFHRAAGQAERHRPHRAGARPVEQRVGTGGDETAIQQRVLPFRTQDVVDAPVRERVVHQPFDRLDHSHSNAPFFHAYTKPITSSDRNTPISTRPKTPSSRNTSAQGKTNAISRSNTMNRIATR